MWKCPVCEKENGVLLCAQCGFDGSMDYERYPTLGEVTALAVAARKNERDTMLKDYYRCTGCGGQQFYLKKENLQPVCVSCGRIKKLAPAATPAPEVRIETPVVFPIAAVSEQENLPTSLLPVGYRGNTIAVGSKHTLAVRTDGRVVATGNNDYGQCNVSGWMDIVAVAAGYGHTVGLRADGTVVATGNNNARGCDVSKWADIVAVAAGGNHTFGLKSNGKVVATKSFYYDGDVDRWENIVAIAAGDSHCIGLRSDGTVVAAGSNSKGQCNVSGWKNIIAIAARQDHSVGLRADGIVVAVGDNRGNQCDVAQWEHITAIATGTWHTLGLKANGTVVVSGSHGYDPSLFRWRNIVAIAGGTTHTVGLKANGTMVFAGNGLVGQRNIADWKNIRLPQNEQTPKNRLGFLSR